MNDLNTLPGWRKATKSGAAGHCVEYTTDGTMHYVRDDKDGGTGPVLTFNGSEWDAFIGGVKNGEFDIA